jgi:phosphatidylserine/phosphatidylglycerophosphate/cardiolipin synthase-like enzyme
MTTVADSSSSRGLTNVSQRELQDLVRAIDAGWLSFPCTALGLGQVGLDAGHCSDVLALFAPCGPAAARSLITVAIAERLHRPPPRLELVWTGPEAEGNVARDTGIIVRQLSMRAKHSVIVGGFRFDHGANLLSPLHEGMQRGLDVTMFVDIEGNASRPEGGKAFAERAIDELLHDNWPFGPPFPAIYYDPRSAVAGPPWVSLHATCVVMDARFAFITSANFTERGQTRNLEVGVCIEDPVLAEQLTAQWQTLIARNLVVRSER